jgi:ribosomal protein S28E/S33
MGIWIVGTTGNVTRIQMDIISYEDKARMMARNTQ